VTTPHVIKPLTPETFPAWLAPAQKHNGVWGRCFGWYFHGDTTPAPWRITCFFVDRDHRRSEVAREALDGALELISHAGGGEVVSFPIELAPDTRTSSSFLHNGTRAMFEKAGFTLERHIGKNKTVMRKTVLPALG